MSDTLSEMRRREYDDNHSSQGGTMADAYLNQLNQLERELEQIKRNLLLSQGIGKGSIVTMPLHVLKNLVESPHKAQEAKKLAKHAILWKIPKAYVSRKPVGTISPELTHLARYIEEQLGKNTQKKGLPLFSNEKDMRDVYFKVHEVVQMPRKNIYPPEDITWYGFKRNGKIEHFESTYFIPVILGKVQKKNQVTYLKT